MSKNLSVLQRRVERANDNAKRAEERASKVQDLLNNARADVADAEADLKANQTKLDELIAENELESRINNQRKLVNRKQIILERRKDRVTRLESHKAFAKLVEAQTALSEAQTAYDSLRTETFTAQRGTGETWEISSTNLSDRVTHCTRIKQGSQNVIFAHLLNKDLAQLKLGIIREAFSSTLTSRSIDEAGGYDTLEGMSDGKIVTSSIGESEGWLFPLFEGRNIKELIELMVTDDRAETNYLAFSQACLEDYSHISSKVFDDIKAGLNKSKLELEERWEEEALELYSHFTHSIFQDEEEVKQKLRDHVTGSESQLSINTKPESPDHWQYYSSFQQAIDAFDKNLVGRMMELEGGLEMMAKALGSTNPELQSGKPAIAYLSTLRELNVLDASKKAFDKEVTKAIDMLKKRYKDDSDKLKDLKQSYDAWYLTTKTNVEKVQSEIDKDVIELPGEGKAAYPRIDLISNLYSAPVEFTIRRENKDNGELAIEEAAQWSRDNVYHVKSSSKTIHTTDGGFSKTLTDWHKAVELTWPNCETVLEAGRLANDESNAAEDTATEALQQFNEKDRTARTQMLSGKALTGGLYLPDAGIAKYLSQFDAIKWKDIVTEIKRQVEAGKTSASFEGILDGAAIKQLTKQGYKVQIKYDTVDHSTGEPELIEKVTPNGIVFEPVDGPYTLVAWFEATLSDQARLKATSEANGWTIGWSKGGEA